MLQKLKNVASSYLTTLILLLIYAVGLAVATFIEKYNGTDVAKKMVYYAPWFFVLHFLMVLNFIALVLRYNLLRVKKWGMITIHLAFIIILIGASTSFFFGEEGILHLREGSSDNQIVCQAGDENYLHTLPFEVELLKFTLTRYPGSSSPSSFESEVLVHVDGKTRQERIYMNNVLDVKGYRLFQASYDTDEKGTVLSVNKDEVGKNITYTGYLLLIIGFILCFFEPNSRIRILIRNLSSSSASAKIVAMLFILGASAVHSKAQTLTVNLLDTISKYAISTEHAKKFGATPMQSNSGRMLPMNTFSSEILRKIHKSTQINKLESDEFLLSLLALPELWMRIPLINYKSDELANRFNLTKEYCSYLELFDEHGGYRLNQAVEDAYHKPVSERSGLEKELIKLDEKANILHQLFNFQMLNLFPKEDEPNHTWFAPGDDLSSFTGKDSLLVAQIFPWYINEVRTSLLTGDWEQTDKVLDMIHTYQKAKNKTLDISPAKIQAELKYNQLNIFKSTRIAYLVLGGILLVLSILSLFEQTRLRRGIVWALIGGVLLSLAYQTYGLGLRWYISGHAPWSNSYETMVYVAWATVLAGLLFIRKSKLTLALATLFGGIILFVSGLNWMDPEINPLVPVLKSPWLMFHVAVIVAAYGFFGISCLLGATNQVLMILSKSKSEALIRHIKELTKINEIALWVGLMLMTIGTFLGAIWANESWGRYWGWDPKETWALITVVIYAIVLHLRLAKRTNSVWLFNVLSTISFASVLMTFLGVNYFLSGMHSYGQNDSVNSIFGYLYIITAIVFILALISKWRIRNSKLGEMRL